MKPAYNLIVILGPTASGKTRLGAKLAALWDSEIISADSRQVYRGMDIGTGKDLADYEVDGRVVPFHMIDIIDPREEFSVYDYQQLFYRCFAGIRSRGIIPVLVGGSGMYIESVLLGYRMPRAPVNRGLRRELEQKSPQELIDILKGLKPVLHNVSDLADRSRILRAIEIAAAPRQDEDDSGAPEIRAGVFGILWEREKLKARIADRLRSRLDEGLIEEVQRLRAKGLSWERLEAFGLEYRYVSRFLKGEINRGELVSTLETRIFQFAKRQMTWFRRMEKRGILINWVRGDDEKALHILAGSI